MSLETSPQTVYPMWARSPEPGETVHGTTPGVVVTPSTVDELSQALAWANDDELKVVPCGLRTKHDRGAPPQQCDVLLDLSKLNRVVEHAAGDLTVTVQAGLALGDLQAVLGQAEQFLAIDPPVPGSIGGLIATADSGPRRLRYGGVRDLILGVTFVRADGVVARGGGKVVKNVAGYDMPKLLTGSLGTLGVVVEATFRLYPLAQASSTVIVACPSPGDLRRLVGAILHSTLVPTSLDYFAGSGGEAAVVALRFESTPASVDFQATSAARLFGSQSRIVESDAAAALWQRFDQVVATGEGDVLARLIAPVSELPDLLHLAQRGAADLGMAATVRAHVGHGHALLRLHQPDTGSGVRLLRRIRGEAERRGGNLVIWRAPAEVRAQIDVWGDPGGGLDLMRRVKAQFDPKSTLNPGRFVGGI